MAPEPNKKIEDLLKAYGQKRRADAGPDLELHPANRRLLLAEVARLQRRPKPGLPIFLTLRHWRAQLAFGISVLMVAASLWWIFGFRHPAPQPSMQLASAPKQPAEETTDRLPASRPRGDVTDKSSPAKAEKPTAETEKMLKSLALANAPSPAAPPPATPAPPLQRPEVAAGLESGSLLLDKDASSERKLKESPVAAGRRVETNVNLYAFKGVTSPGQEQSSGAVLPSLARQRFQQQTASDSRARGTARRLSGTTTVLQSFEVERDGDRIRITEADGSVYEGRFKTAVPESRNRESNRLGTVVQPPAGPAMEARSSADAPAAQAAPAVKAGGAYFTFQASGTNRTLNQSVLVEAVLVSIPAAQAESEVKLSLTPAPSATTAAPARRPISGVAGTGAVALRRAEPSQQAGSMSAQKIQGTVRIGGAGEMFFEAQSVKTTP